LLKRSPLDDDLIEGPGGAGGTVLVLNQDHGACELVARLVELAGYPALRFADRGALLEQMAEGGVSAVVVDALGTGVQPAFEVLEAIRNGPPASRETAVMILASTDTNRLFAYQSGVDAYLVRPFHSDDLVAALRDTLSRSFEERERFRREQLSGGGPS
jgi:DNA-binding response OmpR family regulator